MTVLNIIGIVVGGQLAAFVSTMIYDTWVADNPKRRRWASVRLGLIWSAIALVIYFAQPKSSQIGF